MNVLSLFDGMSCGRIALERAGVKVSKYYSSEIKDYAIKVANENYPQDKDKRMGNISNIGYKKHFLNDVFYKLDTKEITHSFNGGIDLLIGGSPCQDFSGANRERLGEKGIKSGLFFEYVRLLKECNPRYFLLENVRMKKEHQDFVSEEMGCEPIVIKSELVAPHLRYRLYWTNIPFRGQPKDLKLKLNDFLTDGYCPRDKARTLLESDSRPLRNPVKMVHRDFNKGFNTVIFKNKKHYEDIRVHFDNNFKGKGALEINDIVKNINVSLYDGVRYMNNREREACQTIPIGYTDSLSQNDAACLLGDGWTTDIIAHIFKPLGLLK